MGRGVPGAINPAAGVVCRISRDGIVGDCWQGSVAINPAAAGTPISRDDVVGDCGRAVVAINPAAALGYRISRDGVVGDCRRGDEAINPAAAGCRISRDGVVGNCGRGVVARNPAAVGCRISRDGVVGDLGGGGVAINPTAVVCRISCNGVVCDLGRGGGVARNPAAESVVCRISRNFIVGNNVSVVQDITENPATVVVCPFAIGISARYTKAINGSSSNDNHNDHVIGGLSAAGGAGINGGYICCPVALRARGLRAIESTVEFHA